MVRFAPQLNCKDPAERRQTRCSAWAATMGQAGRGSVRPAETSIRCSSRLRFLIGLAVFRLAVGMWRAFVRRVAAQRTRRLVHMRVAARLALRHRPRFSRLSYVV